MHAHGTKETRNLIQITNGEAWTTSLVIAEAFGKPHEHRESAMSLMQEILEKIENDAAEASRRALANAGLIHEAEAIRDALRAAGVADAKPSFIPHTGNVIFFHAGDGDAMRQALATADIRIAREEYRPSHTHGFREARLWLDGLGCQVWIELDPIPLAMAEAEAA